MKTEFDKSRYVANIRYLANKLNKKIGDLETLAGVSTGYISRINKDDSSAALSAEALMKIADELDVNLELLLKTDLEGLSSTENFLLNFIKKLTLDTDKDDLIWEKISKQQMLAYDKEKVESKQYPLLFVEGELLEYSDDEQAIYGEEIIVSKPPNRSIKQECINGDWFSCHLSNGKNIYLTNNQIWHSSSELVKGVLELYMVDYYDDDNYDGRETGWIEDFLCSTYDSKQALKIAIENLHKSILASSGRLHLDDRVKNSIEQYLNPTKTLFDDEIPF